MRSLRASLLLAGLFATRLLHGQHLLLVQYKNQLYPVIGMQTNVPVALVDGKKIKVPQGDFALKSAPAFQPGFVQIDNWETYGMATGKTSASSYNYNLIFRGDFSSNVPLKDCYLVAYLKLENNEEGVAVCALPNLVPGKKQWVDAHFQLPHSLGRGSYRLYFFSGTGEYLHSKMSLDEQSDRKASPISLVAPPYPDEFKGQGIVGEVVIFCHVSNAGRVLDASVREATQEPFGREALAAVMQWTFVPAIRDHQYVETNLLIPMEFRPPEGLKKK
jgi:TonB family protein